MRRRYVFIGRVHGVGFRATALRVSTGYQLTGWVRNHHDGTVLLEAQGDTAEIDRFISHLSREMARNITNTTHLEIDHVEGESGFSIST